MVWIACLAAYTNGELHGRWVDAAVEHEELVESARQVIASSPSPDAEEWAIFEHDEFGGFRVCEYADLATVARVARGIRDYGLAFGAWAELHDADPDMLEQFSDAYLGHYDSTTEWAEHVLQDTGAERFLDNVPESLRPYVRIDYAAWARDCDLGGDIHVERAERGGVHIFHIA